LYVVFARLLDMKKRLKHRLRALHRGEALVEAGRDAVLHRGCQLSMQHMPCLCYCRLPAGHIQVKRARDVLDPEEEAALFELYTRCKAEVPTYSWSNRAVFFLRGTVGCWLGRVLDTYARPPGSMQ
jgi:hypothetical protein